MSAGRTRLSRQGFVGVVGGAVEELHIRLDRESLAEKPIWGIVGIPRRKPMAPRRYLPIGLLVQLGISSGDKGYLLWPGENRPVIGWLSVSFHTAAVRRRGAICKVIFTSASPLTKHLHARPFARVYSGSLRSPDRSAIASS